MSSVVLSGDTSGTLTVTVPAIAGSNTVTIPAGTGTVAVQGVSTNIVSGTAVASTSGTSIDFTSLPSWVKKITVMFSSVSTNGTSVLLIQLGAGSVTSTGYVASTSQLSGSTGTTSSTAGFPIYGNAIADTVYGAIVITTLGSNIWVASGTTSPIVNQTTVTGGGVTLSGTLDRVRITTVNGTDTFDAGSINILYE